MEFSSKYLEKAVEAIGSLPGIGKKTAMRLALHLVQKDHEEVESLSQALLDLSLKLKKCTSCGNISDHELCQICQNHSRDKSLICLVEDVRDVLAIENTGQFKGTYHVLGGLISPMDGIGPSDLNVDKLIQKASSGIIKELIFGLSTTMEGETTSFYLYRKLAEFDIKLSSIARGIAVGDQLEYADELTLARSIRQRVPYEDSLNQNAKT